MNRWLLLGVPLIGAVAVAIAIGADGGDVKSPAVPPGSGMATGAPLLSARPGVISGFVRDVNGMPVRGARVRAVGGRTRVHASRSGRYALHALAGRRTLVATAPGYSQQTVSTQLRRGRGARADFALAITAPRRVAVPNSADRILVWTSCNDLAALGEAGLRRWIARGADGFICQTRQLQGLGGAQRFTGSAAALRGPDTSMQRALRASPAARLAREGKLLLYLAFYAVNYYNARTPFAEWFDDRGWAVKVLPRVRDLAAAARSMGFTGLAIDQELYPQSTGKATASWAVNYPGNRRPPALVRAEVRKRGRQLMESMLSGFPGLELAAYDTEIPESWYEKVQADINHKPQAVRDDVRVDLWNGLSSVEGYSAIRWFDAVFFKTFHLSGASWDSALQYNASRTYSYLSRVFSNWSYASSRLQIAPFAWIDVGTTPFERARPPTEVAQQLDAFRRWAAGGVFADYAYDGLGDRFDYAPYENAFRLASVPARVDQHPPTLAITSPQGRTRRVAPGQTVSLSGVANDDFALRAVRWYDDRGRQGAARMTWTYSGDMRSGWNGVTRWSIVGLRVPRDDRWITISAEDIHGLAREIRLGVAR
jgi:Carboxypeptidase regulatory-like domain